MKKSIILLSGGLDSTTLMYEYQSEIAVAMSFDYGSKHNVREIEAASLHAEKLGIEHLVIEMDFMTKYFKSSLLLGGDAIPEGAYEVENLQKTVVPFRNGIMLSIAAGLAESRRLDKVLIANHFGDHAVYPDCTREFIDPFIAAVKNGTINGVEVHSPYCDINKRDIALRGKELSIDYATTYSCYNGGDIHCGRCATCVERREALDGFDTTQYEE